METLDTIVTYAYDLTLGGGAFYIGTSLILYLIDRWNHLEVKPKLKTSQAVNIPLELKAAVTEALPLEFEVQTPRALEVLPSESEVAEGSLPQPQSLVSWESDSLSTPSKEP